MAFIKLCVEFTKIPVPVDSAFRVFAGSDAWDFQIIYAGGAVVAVEKSALSACRGNLPNFFCFNANQTNRVL